MSRSDVVDVAYLVAAVCFILALKGLSSPRTARRGNLLGAAGALVAVGATFGAGHLHNLPVIVVALVVGAVIGVAAARSVKMTAIPQMVALFNGVGGAAAALVSAGEFKHAGTDHVSDGVTAAVMFAAVVGCVSFSGSVLTFAKLQDLMTTAPVTFTAGRLVSWLTGFATAVLAGVVVATHNLPLLAVTAVIALAFGVLLVLPVSGADVPVVISLLNSFTGLSVAASGYVLKNSLLLIAGTLVGASGTLLTRMMSQAMGRSLSNILFGAFRASPGRAAAGAVGGHVRAGTVPDVAIMLGYARSVVIVPGYGLAVAQAQHTVHELAELLEKRGVAVSYAIHPVAGRMPGHMNVLLAEANVPYEQLRESAEVNNELPTVDVALVVGANDVVNPSARTDANSAIYGMPIVDVDKAGAVVFLKRSMRPGFAGVDNPLLYDQKTTMLFGDAKDSLTGLVSAVREL
ncbi:MAG: NAD(P)(+) transhydrogenase (Re/Si-specific) subunit beta [Mycobacteriales bacterium]